MKNGVLFIGGLLVVASLLSCSEKPRYADALSPEEAIKTFELEAGFAIETFAAEPFVSDPIMLTFDEQGNAYVVEMADYPGKPAPDAGKGRIKLLKDTNGDGVIDSATVFADGIGDATSLLPYEGGLLVTAAPNIIYYKDTDGDGKADHEEILFSGFFENNSEAQITSLTYGVDNWIYANNNGQRSGVKSARHPATDSLSLAGKDFRFRLDKNLFEAESGAGQFGLTTDDWGHRFFTQNTWHLQTAPIPDRYLNRHKRMPSHSSVANIYGTEDIRAFAISEAPYWRVERSEGRQRQYDAAGLDRTEHVWNHFTGASGGMMYNSGLFPEAYYGSIFTAEVALNLVHRDVINPTREGPFLTAKRAPEGQEKEFLASTDTWFRPVNSTVGPDGALYVVDMYRQHIETPVSIPDSLKVDMDFQKGTELGRIYRIYPEGKRPENPKVALSEKSSAELVGILAHTDQWWRIQAQRLLVERKDPSVAGKVAELLKAHADPRTRLHALYVLEGLNQLSAEHVSVALEDAHPQLRKHGIMLAERYPALVNAVVATANDPEAEVAFQAALSLGEFAPTAKTIDALAKVAVKYGDDAWFRKAILSSDLGASCRLYQILAQTAEYKDPIHDQPKFMEELAFTIGASEDLSEYNAFLATLPKGETDYELGIIQGFAGGVRKAKLNDATKTALINRLKSAALSAKGQEIKDALTNDLTGDN
ncbi:PVC-type heme-binding CxxCH protein [Parapedobacter pyrenivorans]|uniref:PVC-type heme-binding CxxCH protein n=1 Tax=Parapedobacter pyrenivorans TaxID=1305674 RepID=UPI0033409CE9